MPRKSNLDFALLFSLAIFSLIPLGPNFWFVIPAATCICYNSASRWARFVPWAGFFFGLWVLRHEWLGVSQLDILAYFLLFCFGAILVWARKSHRSFVSLVFWPFAVGFVSCIVLIGSNLWFGFHSLRSFFESESKAFILPHFFHREAWVLSKDLWSQWSLDLYDSVLAPVFKAGILGWFASMMGFAFFLNGVFETMIRGFRTPQIKKRMRLWAEFNTWKAPDWILIVLLVGLVLIAMDVSLINTPYFRVLGWTLTVCSLFPVFCQGICFASFLIPRASFLPFVLIFALLIINPVPVLLLAGLADLWFDLRSRMSSSPQV